MWWWCGDEEQFESAAVLVWRREEECGRVYGRREKRGCGAAGPFYFIIFFILLNSRSWAGCTSVCLWARPRVVPGPDAQARHGRRGRVFASGGLFSSFSCKLVRTLQKNKEKKGKDRNLL